ncbi:hypothetical protein E2C01_062855 [Portunus trituberculatus]|uniref:Uncharacterized protein n=1 Tax=Portunus trituberculatus TaxID=210409 RepID=A0A5B7HCA1_PORTR|nr:hypothetical protein [Portunus trituberculatus]
MMVEMGTAKALAFEVDAGRTLPAMNFVCCAKVVSCVQPALAMIVEMGTAKALALEVDAGRPLPTVNFVVSIPQMPNITFSHCATVSLDTNL